MLASVNCRVVEGRNYSVTDIKKLMVVLTFCLHPEKALGFQKVRGKSMYGVLEVGHEGIPKESWTVILSFYARKERAQRKSRYPRVWRWNRDWNPYVSFQTPSLPSIPG